MNNRCQFEQVGENPKHIKCKVCGKEYLDAKLGIESKGICRPGTPQMRILPKRTGCKKCGKGTT